jgi:anti-sigma factor RsiW
MALRKRLENLSDADAAFAQPHHASALARIRRWLASGWRPMAASLGMAAALVLTANLWWLHSSRDDRLMDEVTASHVRSTLGQHLVDVASSDHHTVKPWLSSKLDFSPPVTDLKDAGSTFLGGRVDYLDGRPVAALVYRQGQHVVNSFVWPGSAAEGEPRFATERGYRTAHWSRNGMTHWVISDLNDQEFRALIRAIEKAD